MVVQSPEERLEDKRAKARERKANFKERRTQSASEPSQKGLFAKELAASTPSATNLEAADSATSR